MARNLSLALSPKNISPLFGARNIFISPKSEKKTHNLLTVNNGNSSSSIVRKLNFTSDSGNNFITNNTTLTPVKRTNLIPKINIDNSYVEEQCDKKLSTLLINTPNKFDLRVNGFEHFKNSNSFLGKGSFGIVFKGKYQDKIVATKLVSRENTATEKNGIGLDHKNIVKTIEIICDSAEYKYNLVIMELINNCRTLQEIIENHYSSQIKLKKLKEFAKDVTNGLNYLHNIGIIHLDLKPKNILVTTEDICKICDFGNSAKIDENDQLSNYQYIGTPIYTAPEILQGKKPSLKSDIYSLGLVFWQMKYLKDPFQEYGKVQSIIYQVGKFGLRPSYDDENDQLVKIFVKCWANIPEERPNCLEILEELNCATF